MKQGKITNSIVLNDIGLEIIQTPRSSVKKILDEENLNYREIEEQKAKNYNDEKIVPSIFKTKGTEIQT